MRFADDYEKNEWLGREALKELKLIYPQYFKWDLHFTTGKWDDYDAYFFIIDETQRIKKRVWIELKIRERIFPNYILEKKKLNQLRRKRDELFLKEDEVIFLYINYTPNETILWDITNIDMTKTQKIMANKATCESRTNKTNKDVILLDPKDGKRLEYIIQPTLLLKNYDDYLLSKVKEQIKKKTGLEDILFG
jgi:hypothetical protein